MYRVLTLCCFGRFGPAQRRFWPFSTLHKEQYRIFLSFRFSLRDPYSWNLSTINVPPKDIFVKSIISLRSSLCLYQSCLHGNSAQKAPRRSPPLNCKHSPWFEFPPLSNRGLSSPRKWGVNDLRPTHLKLDSRQLFRSWLVAAATGLSRRSATTATRVTRKRKQCDGWCSGSRTRLFYRDAARGPLLFQVRRRRRCSLTKRAKGAANKWTKEYGDSGQSSMFYFVFFYVGRKDCIDGYASCFPRNQIHTELSQRELVQIFEVESHTEGKIILFACLFVFFLLIIDWV